MTSLEWKANDFYEMFIVYTRFYENNKKAKLLRRAFVDIKFVFPLTL